LGNVGDFDENFNNRPTNYFIDSFTYSTGTEIELTANEQDFTIVVRNTVDTPFSNNNTKFVLHFGRTWTDEDYTSNGKNVDTNFYNDRLLQTVGSTAVNGINFGGNYQVFKGVTATLFFAYLAGLISAFLFTKSSSESALFFPIAEASLTKVSTDFVRSLITSLTTEAFIVPARSTP
jgi:hypothetical protein